MPDFIPEDVPKPRLHPRSCPTCHSIGSPVRVPGTGLPGEWCRDAWHQGSAHKPSHVFVEVPTVRPTDPLAREIADGIRHIEYNYAREGAGPGSRFEGKLLEDVQAEWVMRELLTRNDTRLHLLPAGMVVSSLGEPVELVCREHGVVITAGDIGLRTLSFEARRHWREKHTDG